jgi:serine/threonine-protein kinase RsbW
MAKSRVAMDVEIPSDVKYIEDVVELATRKCRELRISPQKCTLNVRVALAEAISNAILRGNGEAPGKHVRVRATVSDDKVVFDIVDEGPGFDLDEERPDPTAPENLMSEDGRGLFLMHRLMDRVERFQRDGNVVRLTLHRE